MKRAIVSGGLFVAPILIAGSLLGAAKADQRQVIALQLDTVCVDSASHQALYALQNKNDFSIDVSWNNLDTHTSGLFTVPANSFNGYDTPLGYATDYDPSNPNNTTQFTAEGWTSPNTTNARVGVACNPDQVPAVNNGGGTGGNTGGNTGTGTGSTTGGSGADTPVATTTDTTTNNGGKGGDSSDNAVTADTSAQLADTGAQQIVPLAAAALLAVAVLGTTTLVRKNVL